MPSRKRASSIENQGKKGKKQPRLSTAVARDSSSSSTPITTNTPPKTMSPSTSTSKISTLNGEETDMKPKIELESESESGPDPEFVLSRVSSSAPSGPVSFQAHDVPETATTATTATTSRLSTPCMRISVTPPLRAKAMALPDMIDDETSLRACEEFGCRANGMRKFDKLDQLIRIMRSINRNMFHLLNTVRVVNGLEALSADEEVYWDDVIFDE